MAQPNFNDNVKALAKQVTIRGIRFERGEMEFFGKKAEDKPDVVEITLGAAGVKSPDLPRHFRAVIDCSVVAFPSAAKERRLARMMARVVLEYEVSSQELFDSLNDVDMSSFAGLNGAFNAWPYLREYFQSSSARMNVGTFILPALRVENGDIRPSGTNVAGKP